MKLGGKAVMILGLVVIAVSILISARTWPPQSALFPTVISFFCPGDGLRVLACLPVWKEERWRSRSHGRETAGERRSGSVQSATDLHLPLAYRFFILIVLFGFPITIPLFMFLYLKVEGKEGWVTTLELTVGVWACFYFLFIWLLKTPFPEGWVLEWLSGT